MMVGSNSDLMLTCCWALPCRAIIPKDWETVSPDVTNEIQYLEWRLCEMTGATFDAKSPERPYFRGIKAAFLAAVRMVRVNVSQCITCCHGIT
jgi:hypothetical protein